MGRSDSCPNGWFRAVIVLLARKRQSYWTANEPHVTYHNTKYRSDHTDACYSEIAPIVTMYSVENKLIVL